MSEGRKLYSLLVKDASGIYYRMKVGDSYYGTLAEIDTYTSECKTESDFYEGKSSINKLNIVDAFIVYKNDGQTKTLRPVFKDMKELIVMANLFGNASEITINSEEDYEKYGSLYMQIRQNAAKVFDAYKTNDFVRQAFDRQGSYLVKQSLQEQDFEKLVRGLCRYRELRQTMQLYVNALQGKRINVFPEAIKEPLKMDIKLIEERELELVDSKIAEISQKADTKDKILRNMYTEELNKLYGKKEELEENLGQDNNEVKGQIRLF